MNFQNSIGVASSNSQSYLKLLEATDFPLFYAIYGDAGMMKFIGRHLSQTKARKIFQQALNAQQQKHPRYLTFAIIDKATSSSQGIIGLEWHSQYNRTIAEIGVMVLPQWRRKKVAHNAKNLLIGHAFENYSIQSIFASCSIENTAANNANKKLGFVANSESIKNKSPQSRTWVMSLQQWQLFNISDEG